MKREVTLEEISDGRLYDAGDMVKADCYDCKGCSDCCRGMGSSIVLTPYDIYMLTVRPDKAGIHSQDTMDFGALMNGYIELNVIDGVILPTLKMNPATDSCSFLNEEGRCSIHPFRPGICRLFPLGRYYEEDGFRYFLQTHECRNNNRGKIKVSKWLDTPELKKNEQFILRWHEIVKNFEEYMSTGPDYEQAKALNMKLLQIFFIMPYEDGDFYEQIEKRFGMWQ